VSTYQLKDAVSHFRVELSVRGHSKYINTTVICPYYINTGMFTGVQSRIIPILDPGFVADESVKAILTNKEVLLLPWACSLLITLKTILPSKGFMYLSSVFGFNCSMDQFEGRTA
jgi:all-trans-retinol dehydrogenase (NAD+)